MTPESFEEHLRYLQSVGYRSVGLEDWRIAIGSKRPLPGRAVMLTFDVGGLDFVRYARPLLTRYGFSAIVFLVSEQVVGIDDRPRTMDVEVSYLGWEQVRRLRTEGIEFGSNSVSYRSLCALSPEEIVREATCSRAALQRAIEAPIRAFAYPHGDEDYVVRHLIGACGYIYGLSIREVPSRLDDSLLALPRIDVSDSNGLQEFIARLKM